jgi:hydrogenase nickel incorporation protein HypA/HybF
MHELSIAMGIVDIATEEADRRGADRVDVVHLKLGRMSGVVPRALLASYEMACEQTPLAGSRLEIEDVPVVIHCSSCSSNVTIEGSVLVCPSCGTPSAAIVTGREIEVVALELT